MKAEDDGATGDAVAVVRQAPRPGEAGTATARPGDRWRFGRHQVDPQDGTSGVVGHRLAAVRDWLAQCYATEMASGNQFSWFVVAFAAGAALYLRLPREPTLCVMLLAGVWAGSFEAIRVAGPRLDTDRTVTVTGWVSDEEAMLKGARRLTIRVAGMQARRLPPAAVPAMITVTFRASAPHPAIGDGIRFLARLRPLPGPVMPGGYDFARRAYFDQRGASGYALGRVESAELGAPDFATELRIAIAGMRHAVSQRIRDALPGARGAIAAAIIVGEQRGIPDAENDALRASGLPHMITIAGLHMSIVAGVVFFAIRGLLALIPAIALRFPIKTWAAGGALVATTFYMVISGSHVSAERAYLMGAIMLVSVMLGRPALSMRNLALTALILLILNPAQVIEPGFLMSFLAVMALIAAYQAWWKLKSANPVKVQQASAGPFTYVAGRIVAHGFGAAASSVIATLATASVTADQFFRVPPYGALSNLVVLPAIELIAMPAAVLGCLLMPFGLEALPLTVMGWAIDFMTSVGFFAADLPGGQGLVGRIHPWTTALAIAGLCWLCLWQKSWRLLGVVPLVVALMLAPFASRPDILIAADAASVAVRDADGGLKILNARQNRFIATNWLMADAAPSTPADPRAPLDPHLGDGWRCDRLGCLFVVPPAPGKAAHRIAVVVDLLGFEEDCFNADIVISHLNAPASCAETALVFDRERLQTSGAVALTRREIPPPVSPALDLGTREPSPPADIEITASTADRSRPWHALPEEPLPASASHSAATTGTTPP